MKHFIYSLVIVLCLSSCYSTQQVEMQSDYAAATYGLTKLDAITQFGEPNRIFVQDSLDVYVYEHYEGKHEVANRQYLNMYFDSHGVCRDAKTNYTKPIRYRDDKKTNWAVWGSINGVAVVGLITYLVYRLRK